MTIYSRLWFGSEGSLEFQVLFQTLNQIIKHKPGLRLLFNHQCLKLTERLWSLQHTHTHFPLTSTLIQSLLLYFTSTWTDRTVGQTFRKQKTEMKQNTHKYSSSCRFTSLSVHGVAQSLLYVILHMCVKCGWRGAPVVTSISYNTWKYIENMEIDQRGQMKDTSKDVTTLDLFSH